jgi:hypothetical protein
MGLFRSKKSKSVMENTLRPKVEEPAAASGEVFREEPSSGNGNRQKSGEPQGPRLKPLLWLRSLLDGTLLADERMIRNIPYILFLTGLAILYISNSSTAEKNRREAAALTDELKELRYQYISTKSGVMHLSNPSQISKKLKETGIKENTVPPVKIFIQPVAGK